MTITTLSHIISASYIAIGSAGISVSETKYVMAAIVSAGVLDFDHIVSLIKDRKLYRENGYAGNLHKARTPLHELLGFALVGTVVLIISLFDFRMAYVVGVATMVHLAEDMIVGKSIPFNPVDKTEVNLLPQKKVVKLVIEVMVLLFFGWLWIRYLSGQN